MHKTHLIELTTKFCQAFNAMNLDDVMTSFSDDDGTTCWRGLDILVFNAQGKISEKLTYAKAEVPLFYNPKND
jgi:hypothetical protein